MAKNEQELIDQILRGDLSAFQGLVEIHKKKVYFVAYDIVGNHHDAEDLSQEVFIKVYRSIQSFRKDAKMSSWLYQITVNTCIDFLRKKSTRTEDSIEEVYGVDMRPSPWKDKGNRGPELDAEGRMLQSRIQAALTKITPKERTVFVMRQYNDFKISEIAEILHVSEGTVKSLMFRAIKKLRKELEFLREETSLEAVNG